MNKLLLLPLLALSMNTLAPIASAKDKHDKDDYKSYYKGIKDDMNSLRNHWGQVRDRVKYLGGDRRQWAQLQDISADIDRLSFRLDRGDIDPREAKGRISQLHDSLRGVQAQLENKGRGGDWRSGGDYRGDYRRDWR